jgi:type VI secretion system protein ImpA
LHGFAGLRDGFRLVRELSERFWDGIHPRPDEEGYATTVAQLTGLNGDDSQGALLAPIADIPVTSSPTYGNLSSSDHLDAMELEQVADSLKRAQRIEQGACSLEIFDKAAADTSAEFFRQSLDDLDQAISEFGRMNAVLEEKCGKDASGYPLAPPSSNLGNALTACRDRLAGISRHILVSEEGPQELGTSTTLGSPAVDKSRMPTREDAFRSLLQVADFFRRTEPHSPVSYALEQAVRWGRMPLPELLQELIMDENVRKDLFRRTGIGSGEPSSG